MGGKRKASAFTDEERADAVALYHLRGGPDRKGALTETAKHLNIWPNTLRRWETGESNPPPTNIVIKKKEDIRQALFELLGLAVFYAKREVSEATFRELSTTIGIVTDKILLLSGEPTQRIVSESTHRITENIDRSEYDDVIREAEDIISQAQSGLSDS